MLSNNLRTIQSENDPILSGTFNMTVGSNSVFGSTNRGYRIAFYGTCAGGFVY